MTKREPTPTELPKRVVHVVDRIAALETRLANLEQLVCLDRHAADERLTCLEEAFAVDRIGKLIPRRLRRKYFKKKI